ncbi:hypothetical protein CALCODRAFT_485103 [Calocera cornea HHB12733]|uniref:Mid2 domain-containing protein n=1 Tax=Calocera cornea HHB12733 TaxID=1353952 RepID=A0A165EIU4_9BASI|nr:hypothetical protein CALCODRAFT_485103 [Calocera cornea HHB12733]
MFSTAGVFLSLLVSFPAIVRSWNFSLSSDPAQCTDFNIIWTGGVAPRTFSFYSLAGIGTPYNEWASGWQYDVFLEQEDELQTTQARLPFASGTPVVAVASDAQGFATGGTSVMFTINDSDDEMCVVTYDNTEYLNLVPLWSPDSPYQCASMTSVFSAVELPITIDVVLPGGQSYSVGWPAMNSSDVAPTASSSATVLWTLDSGDSKSVVYAVSDANARLFVSGLNTVGSGTNDCSQNRAPSSTWSGIANAQTPTSATFSPSGKSTTSPATNSRVEDIAGGIAGGVSGLILVMAGYMFILRRRRRNGAQVDSSSIDEPTAYIEPIPFILHGMPDEEEKLLTQTSPAILDGRPCRLFTTSALHSPAAVTPMHRRDDVDFNWFIPAGTEEDFEHDAALQWSAPPSYQSREEDED